MSMTLTFARELGRCEVVLMPFVHHVIIMYTYSRNSYNYKSFVFKMIIKLCN